jgi:membrane protein DedA with SNARE-associated domain
MDDLLTLIARHGYSILALIVFLEAIGIPIPAAVALLAAGAASARGLLRADLAFAVAVAAMAMGDILLYLLGRYTGWWLLGLLCRVSLNPETCILRSAEAFYRRGRMTLLIAKFVPGINTMAPPLAGSMNMKFWQFLRLDVAGACLYVLTFSGLGLIFSGFIAAIGSGIEAVGRAVQWLIVAGVIAYLLYRVHVYRKHRAYRVVPRVQIEEVARRLAADPQEIVIADVRSHGYYDRDVLRIKGSIRLEPNSLPASVADWPRSKAIYLYCT